MSRVQKQHGPIHPHEDHNDEESPCDSCAPHLSNRGYLRVQSRDWEGPRGCDPNQSSSQSSGQENYGLDIGLAISSRSGGRLWTW